jgi:hypothetical protein
MLLISLGVGCGLCVWAFRDLDWELLQLGLRRAGPWALLVMMAPAVGHFLHMLGWRALLARELRPALWRSFGIFVVAQAGNEVGASFLGESAKVAAFPRAQRRSALRAVVWDNLTALLALGLVVLTVLALPLGLHHAWLTPRSAALGLVLLSAIAAVAWCWLRSRESYCPPLANTIFALIAHYLGKSWIVAEFALALAIVATASWHSSTLLGFASLVGSSVGAPIPGQLGVIEGALVSVASVAGVTVPTVLTVAVLRRVRSLIWVVAGALLCLPLGMTSQLGRAHGATAPYPQS